MPINKVNQQINFQLNRSIYLYQRVLNTIVHLFVFHALLVLAITDPHEMSLTYLQVSDSSALF